MIDPNDNATGELPIDTPAPTPPAVVKRKASPRAKYTEAYIVRCTANRTNDHPAVILLTALVGTGTPHRVVDAVLGFPEETTSRYLTAGVPIETPDGVFDETHAMVMFDMLYRLKTNDAFSEKGLNAVGVLKAMLP